MSAAEDIKARLDIVSYINQYVPLKKSGKNHKACCPFHSENTASFVVDENRQSWRCYGACATGGDIFTFVERYHGWDFKEALRELGQLAGVEVRPRTPEQKQRADRTDLLRGMLKEAASAYQKKLYDPNDAGAVAALSYARQGRGLSDETIAAFGVGYAPTGWDKLVGHLQQIGYAHEDILAAGLAGKSDRTGKLYDRFRNRLVVPIRDVKGQVLGFGGRVLNPDDKPKYLNSPQSEVFDKSRILFGLDLARDAIRQTETAIIVEGYMDVITAHQAGYRNVVAQMGTAMTEAQLDLVAPRFAKHVVLALDSDAAGKNATRRSLEVAREALRADYTGRLSVDVRVLHIPQGKDPDDLIRENPAQWEYEVEHALTVAEFVIEMEMALLPPRPSVQDKEALARRVMPLLTATENNLWKQENVQKLAMRLLLPERDLLRIAHEQAKVEQARPPRPRKQAPQRITPLDERHDGLPPRTDYGAPPAHVNGHGAHHSEEPPPRADLDAAPVNAQQPPQVSQMLLFEARVLHGLIDNPQLYYQLNGRLREVARANDIEPKGAFGALCTDDFYQTDVRELMVVFLHALQQDDADVRDYMLAQTEPELYPVLEMALDDPMRARMENPQKVSARDVDQITRRIRRSGSVVDEHSDLIAQGIRLRCRRLTRERDELELIQRGALQDQDYDYADQCAAQMDRLVWALHLLEQEQHIVARIH